MTTIDKLRLFTDIDAMDKVVLSGSDLLNTRGMRVIYGLPDDQYHAFPGINSGLLKHATAAEMWHDMTQPPEDQYASEAAAVKWTMGTLLHWAVLEPWKFADREKHLMLSPTVGLSTQKAMAERIRRPDLLLVSPEHVANAIECKRAVAANQFAQRILTADGIQREVSCFYFDVVNGVWMKARFDILAPRHNFLADVKTTAAHVSDFPYQIKKFSYHLQAIWYLDIWELITRDRKDYFYHIVVNKESPFMCRCWLIENIPETWSTYKDSFMEEARMKLKARKATFMTALNLTLKALELGEDLTEFEIHRRYWEAYETEAEAQLVTL